MQLRFREADLDELRLLLGEFPRLVDPQQPRGWRASTAQGCRLSGAAGRRSTVCCLWPDPGGERGREARPGLSLGRVLFLGPGASWP